MKNAIIVHGMPSEEEYASGEGSNPSKMHWLPWLKEELEKRGIPTVTPELPKPYAPVCEEWKAAFEASGTINEETILVGHSCGAGFIVRWLSENKCRVGRVVLVGPWLDPEGTLPTGFFDFQIDPSLAERAEGVTVFVSLDDGQAVLDSVARLKKEIPGVIVKEFQHRGHFTLEDMGKREFPELLGALTR